MERFSSTKWTILHPTHSHMTGLLAGFGMGAGNAMGGSAMRTMNASKVSHLSITLNSDLSSLPVGSSEFQLAVLDIVNACNEPYISLDAVSGASFVNDFCPSPVR
jgi:hypothetical protein